MSWLSELKWSNRLEHIVAMIAGDEELDETVVSVGDRKQGFLFHIAQKVQGTIGLPDASEANDGDILALDDDGDPAWVGAPVGLPDFSEAAAGAVLTIVDGEPAWVAPEAANAEET